MGYKPHKQAQTPFTNYFQQNRGWKISIRKWHRTVDTIKVITPKLGIIKYINNCEQICSTKKNLIPLILHGCHIGSFSGWNMKCKRSGWPALLYTIPQWPATETILKEAFISAGATAFKKRPCSSARQSFNGDRLPSRDEMRSALGWFGG